MPKSKRTKEALTWLESGMAPEKRADAATAALVMLAHDVPLDARLQDVAGVKLGADVEMAVALHAEQAEAIDLLVHLRDKGQNKGTAKLAKKVLFRAKQRGVDVPEDAAPARTAVRLARKPEPLPSLCSSFDRDGGHVVVFGGWDEDNGSWALVGVVHHDRGLDTVAWLPKLSRSRFKQVLDDLTERRGGELSEVEDIFAAGRIKWALEHAEAAGHRIEGDRARARRLLEKSHALPGYTADVPGVGGEALAQSAALVDDPCLEAWLTSLDGLLDDAEGKLRSAVAAGTLAPTADAVSAALAAHVSAAFDAAARARLAGRLEITAMLLAKLGRAELAASAASVGRVLMRDELDVMTVPLLQAAVARQAPLDDLVAGLATLAPAGAPEAATSEAASRDAEGSAAAEATQAADAADAADAAPAAADVAPVEAASADSDAAADETEVVAAEEAVAAADTAPEPAAETADASDADGAAAEATPSEPEVVAAGDSVDSADSATESDVAAAEALTDADAAGSPDAKDA